MLHVMRPAIVLVLAAASCATPDAAGATSREVEQPTEDLSARRAAASDRLASLRWRSTWPSAPDRERWERLHARAEHAEVVAAGGRPDDVRSFCASVDALEQIDALFRVGESARRPR